MDDRQLFLPLLPRFIDPARAAEIVRVSHSTILRWCEDGKIPGAYKVVGRWRIDRERFEDWVEELRRKGIRI